MPETSGQERTEKATPKKREDARRKGQVAMSREVSSAMILLGSLGFFYFAGSWMFWNLSEVIRRVFQNIGTLRFESINDASVFSMELLERLLSILIPFVLPLAILGLVANIMQVGFQLSSEAMAPKLSKLNPIAGIKRFVSLKALVELAKSLVKLLIIGSIAYVLVKSDMDAFPLLIHQEVGQILVFIARVALKIGFFVCLALIVLATLDFLYQRWQHEKDLRMTKQEVKDEQKQTYGDPKVKSRIRSMQLEMARRRMMEAVPEADVVITNPTHLAIAIKFDAAKMVAPQVLAKGAGHVAQRIKEIAAEHEVPLVEDKPLAQALYKMVELGDYIPAELYRAVAEVLAYVYRLKGMYRRE
ncbi:MAG: flagellar biosynthesis protein FlhB [Deltaproteobacteria bacterium]|jgi:flagellar biosynthetic protein FlhB|nr:flagellar biosynthesis protein FlhB [Deltaproteobacteria bacterium]MBW2483079.1 flagellar biosynthesis protein FlhB [Deltaproteobacteria bacterium]